MVSNYYQKRTYLWMIIVSPGSLAASETIENYSKNY